MELPKRKPNRLSGYDYSQPGIYFITFCTYNRRCILSDVIVGAIHALVPDRFNVEIHSYTIMPNHVHLLIEIRDDNDLRAIRESPLHGRQITDKIVGYIKMNSSKKIHSFYPSKDIWQRSYHDYIIRDESDFLNIWNYIEFNQCKWQTDKYYK